ncbi:MAG: lamin tail domain-containing protein, partial [Deltaproteobacteria bacterium]|nr:lamin tail domain-containing protein [Deltaproteobacteria bacterium]
DTIVPTEVAEDTIVPTEVAEDTIVPTEVAEDTIVPTEVVEDTTVTTEVVEDVADDAGLDADDALETVDDVVLGCPEDPMACPVGESCANPETITVDGPQTITADLGDMMSDDHPKDAACGIVAAGRELVWRVVVPDGGDVTIAVTPDAFDVVVYTFTDATCSRCGMVLDEVGLGETETFRATGFAPGSELWLVADATTGSGGALTLAITPEVAPCSVAFTMTHDRGTYVATGDLTDPSLTGALDGADCGQPDVGTPNQVFAFTAPWTGSWRIRVAPTTDLDPRVQVRGGYNCSLSACVGASDSALAGEAEVVDLVLEGDRPYWLVVDSLSAAFDGTFVVTIEPTSIATLAEVRQALNSGVTTGAWVVDGAVVTTVKPPAGTDPAGFIIQAGPLGPALLIETPEPTVVPGDVVRLQLLTLRLFSGASTASTWDNLEVVGSFDVGDWAQDISGVDPVANLPILEQELVDLDGVIAAAATPAGGGHLAFNVTTAGYPTASTSLRVRVPVVGFEASHFIVGCDVSLRGGFLWRFSATAQPSTYDPRALAVSCPPMRVIEAAPASTTHVRIFFDLPIDPTSILTDGSQFDFGPGLIATGAVAELQSVLVTTGPQTAARYTVTVAPDVRDVFGNLIDPDARTETFVGFTGPTRLVINEIDYDQSAAGDTGEFVEIFNGTSEAIDLTGYQLELMNGAAPYGTIPLSGLLPEGGYLLVARAGMAVSADIVVRFEDHLTNVANGAIQNGPADGVRLRSASGLAIDSLLYEATTSLDGVGEGTPFAGGEDNFDPNRSLQRCPGGADSDDNTTDFVLGTPSPGRPNCLD